MERIGTCLKILADETRIRILHLLAQEPLTVAELQELLVLRQSSVSSHLAKLRQAGLIDARAEGSSHRYRLHDRVEEPWQSAWNYVRSVSERDPDVAADRCQLERLRSQRGSSWIERVAGSLHRSYAPGRTWESLGHGLLHFADFGRCVDIGAGDGAMLDVLSPRSRELCCVDPSSAMCLAAEEHRRRRGLENVRVLAAAGEDLPLSDDGWDSVLFLQSLQYIGDPPAALAEAHRILRPGGRLLVLTLTEHDFVEAERYGHRHRGFCRHDLEHWGAELGERQCYTLPPEDQPPRFQTLVMTGVKLATSSMP